MNNRPTWDEYFMQITLEISKRATCFRRKVGAVITRENRIIATGYNGSPSKMKDCLEFGKCLRDELKIPSGSNLEMCRGLHAEQNALIQAAKFGISTDDSTCYITHHPCIICAKLLISAGITRIVYYEEYPDRENITAAFFREAGVTIERFKGSCNT